MDREKALEELPTAYAVALRMREGEASDRAIAKALGVPEESIRSLVKLAEAKLAAIVGSSNSTSGPDHRAGRGLS